MLGRGLRRAHCCARAFCLWVAVAVIGPEVAAAGPAIGQLEIKSLNMVPGRVELQSQNAFGIGDPRRGAILDDGEIEADDNSIAKVRAALEAEYTFNHYFKTRIGIEFEDERIDDASSFEAANQFGPVRLEEYELEAIVVLVPRPEQGFALGLLGEYEHPAASDGARTFNLGPIVEWISGPWLATFNPSLVSFFGGEQNAAGKHDEKVDFRYTARLMYRAADDLALALEAYGTVERIGATGSPGEEALLFGDFNQHRLGPVIYWSIPAEGKSEFTLGVGALAGLNEQTPDATLKLSFELEF
jgi:hypothetical protein